MRPEVQQYYGEVLQTSADLKTTACCTVEELPAYAKPLLGLLHEEVLSRYFGCGLVLPEALGGCEVLDLGCGAGRDCFLLAGLVGAQGRVVGVDATPEQLAVARRHEAYHQQRLGYAHANTRFLLADIERLDEAGLAPGSFDVIVSNCVINLATDKRAVLESAWRLLKPGGELYFADIYADRRVPEMLARDPVLYGECLSGALYWNDFLQLAKSAGFADPRLVADRPVQVTQPELAARVGDIRFFSATYRLFRLAGLEPACEDYGQAVAYRGGIAHHPHRFVLDKHHVFPAGKVVSVCGNTWRMLAETRLREGFEFFGTGEVHHGIFEGCGSGLPFEAAVAGEGACC